MNFDEKYPGVSINTQPEGEDVFLSNRVGPCSNCKQDTAWVSLSFEAWMCSEECENKVWLDYYAAMKKSESSLQGGM